MPYKVVINESINLAKYFSADGSHRYVNGILDKVAQQKRAVEIKSKAQGARIVDSISFPRWSVATMKLQPIGE
jgi:NusB family